MPSSVCPTSPTPVIPTALEAGDPSLQPLSCHLAAVSVFAVSPRLSMAMCVLHPHRDFCIGSLHLWAPRGCENAALPRAPLPLLLPPSFMFPRDRKSV